MSAVPDSAPQSPFSLKAVLAIVLFGAVVFIALLWMIGSGTGSGSSNDGGAHGGGKGLSGYAAMADFLERRGMTVRRSMSEAALDDRGLLVLTPPHYLDGTALAQIVGNRRYAGPTLIVVPKWIAAQPPANTPGAKKGWVTLAAPQMPEWRGFLDDASA